MIQTCPICAKALPPGTRPGFCPICSLRGALDGLAEDEFDEVPVRLLGDYELLEQIGRGGMGVVWKARQRSLHRVVAVKLIAAGELAGPEARRRFRDEARAAAQLRHPHIVGIHEIGEQDGQAFFSMDLLEGGTVADRTRSGPLAAREAAELLWPVAEAIQWAHEHGVLHRDLKPSNLLLEKDGAVRVSDFGLSRRLDAEQRDTQAGDVLGSPAYLAPEQARGDREGEGVWTDVYALGAILYELITGRPPFLGESPVIVLQHVLQTDPVAPRQLNPAVPVDLQSIAMKCLEKDPRRRYATAAEVTEELRRFLRGQPVRVRPLGAWGRTTRWARRHPARAGLLAAVALLVTTLSVVPSVAYWKVRQAEQARNEHWRETLLSQARAIRLGGRSGQRQQSLQVLREAARLPSDVDFRRKLRREYVASLAWDDVEATTAPELPAEPDPTLLRLSRDGRYFARSTFRGPLRLYSQTDGRELARLETAPRTVQHVLDFSPDGRFLAVRHGREIAVWDWTNRVAALAQLCRLESVAFRPDSRGVAMALADGSVVEFGLPGGERIWHWDAPSPSPVEVLAYAPDGRVLALGCGNSRLLQWRDVPSGRLLRTLEVERPLTAMAWSIDGSSFAAGDERGRVMIWSAAVEREKLVGETLASQGSFEAHAGHVRALGWSPDGRWLTSAGYDENVRFLDTRTGRLGLALPGETFQLCFSADGTRVGPVWQGRRPCWLQLTPSDVYSAWRRGAEAGRSFAVALDRTGSQVACTQAGALWTWHLGGRENLTRWPVPAAHGVAFTAENLILATTPSGLYECLAPTGTPRLRSAVVGDRAVGQVGGPLLALPNFAQGLVTVLGTNGASVTLTNSRVADAALSPDGRWLVVTSLDQGETRLWDWASGQVLRSWPDEGDNHVVFSPDGRWLAQFAYGCRFLDTRTWQAQRAAEALPANANPGGGAFSPDGKLFAVTAADAEIHLLRVPDWVSAGVLQAPTTAHIKSLVWSGDGTRLAAATKQGEVLVWDLQALQRRLDEQGLAWK